MTLYQLLADRALADDPSLDPDQCWEWPGAHRYGYGVVYHDGRKHQAHRLAYSLVTGPIPAGLVVDHWVCSNPGCWRPSHMRAVTNKVNTSPERSRSPERVRQARLARHAARTACRNGHPYSADNTLWYTKQGGHYRICRACRKAQGQSQWASPGCHPNCPHTPHISTTGAYQAWLATTQSQHKETAA